MEIKSLYLEPLKGHQGNAQGYAGNCIQCFHKALAMSLSLAYMLYYLQPLYKNKFKIMMNLFSTV